MAAEAETNHMITGIVTVLLAIIGVAILAELVSMRSNTTGVVSAGSSAISRALCTALSPVMGGSCGVSVTSTINYGGITTGSPGGVGGGPNCFQGICT